ncbi:uncharacterized protein LOC116224738 [Clupea harengus]|uniref:Uncharacterized protein LOC116224738 n=1 Tax=Clupea harengus TaxID=7950 RepID=A0A6P8GRU3_CLUHA|nr:uncharacterized protein LOC116224738 [Clupea harengus]
MQMQDTINITHVQQDLVFSHRVGVSVTAHVCECVAAKMRIVFLVLLLVPLGWTKREYFLQSNASSWELARQHCQVCYRELATITAEDARHMLEKLDNSSRAVWVGLRRRLNETVASNTTNSTGPESHWFSGTAPWFQSSNDTNGTWFSFFEGKLPWSRWANGDPVTFQNWYPGRPVPKPRPEPIKCDPNAGASTYTTTPSYTTESGYSTVDGTSTTGMPNQNSTNGTAEQRNDTYMCPQLKKLLECVDDQGAKDALSRYLNQSSNATTPGSNQTDLNRSLNATTPDPADLYSAFPGTIPTSTSAPGTTSTSAATSTSAPSTTFTSAAPTTSPCPNVTDIREADLNRFIEDACLVLLSFGLWWERACSEVLPYVCYDDRFYGEVNVSDITYTSAGVKWLEAPGAISGYRVEVKSEEHNWTETLTSNLTTQFQNLTAGTKYTVCVFPIKCGRDLNPQTTYFYSQPDHIRNLTLVQIQETSVTLSWRPPPGGIDIYRLCVYNSSLQISCVNITSTIHTIKDLVAGGEHTVEVSAEVADMSIPGRRFNKTFFTSKCPSPFICSAHCSGSIAGHLY